MASDNVSIVKAFMAEFGAGSLDKAFAYFTDDATWGITQKVRGTEMSTAELRTRLEAMRAAFKDKALHTTLHHFIEQGDVIAVEAESHSETVLGKMYNNKYCIIFRLKEGKIAGVNEYNDSLHVMDTLVPAIQHALAKTA